MRNKPTGVDLLLVARKSLVEQLIPSLPEEKRGAARLIARAINIASREAENGEKPLRDALERVSEVLGKDVKSEIEFAQSSPDALERVLGELSVTLSKRIRAGEFDATSKLRDKVHGHLLATTLDKLREDDPRFLEAEGLD